MESDHSLLGWAILKNAQGFELVAQAEMKGFLENLSDLRMVGRDLIEILFGQANQFRWLQDSHRRRTRPAGEQRDLPEKVPFPLLG